MGLGEYPTKIPISRFWNEPGEKNIKMHNIHYYPAKFPALIVSKSLEYAKEKNIKISTIADIFCGCGTTALEARRKGINFWGCDINPVATLIAKTKSQYYVQSKLKKYSEKVLSSYLNNDETTPAYYLSHPRIKYWFSKSQISDLYHLLSSIKKSVPKGKYQDFFMCAFSNILKPASRWLTKSIKPQVDPNKRISKVRLLYTQQVDFMVKAMNELKKTSPATSQVKIITANYLNLDIKKPFADMIITSPPYVTSYEYADLHQLSAIWLGFSDDYRTLRQGSIGSLYHDSLTQNKLDEVNEYAKMIYDKLSRKDSRKAKSVVKYFYDLKNTVDKAYKILKSGGLSVFVIGNTEYSGVAVNNAKYLHDCMLERGFSNITISKRIIRGKTLSPYRDSKGRFSSNSKDRKVYRYEFVIIAEKIK